MLALLGDTEMEVRVFVGGGSDVVLDATPEHPVLVIRRESERETRIAAHSQ
jgi:hypothetical protein